MTRVLKLRGVREAIYLATPDLHNRIAAWEINPESERGHRIGRSLFRYFARMSARATPFGLFAGFALGAVGDQTDLRLASRETYRRTTRLDTQFLGDLADAVLLNRTFGPVFTIRPNSSLYAAGGRFHYMEAYSQGGDRAYRLVAVDRSDPLDEVIRLAENGATIAELALALVNEDVSVNEARDFVYELLDAQIIVADIEPLVTGMAALDGMIDTLSTQEVTAPTVDRLKRARELLANIDARGIGCSVQDYNGIAELLGEFPVRADPARLFQVDMSTSLEAAVIGAVEMHEIEAGIDLLQRITLPTDPLRSFRRAFRERYEMELVPLAEALDAEIGIGLDNLGLEGAVSEGDLRELSAEGARQAVLAGLVIRAAKSGAVEVALTADDVASLASRTPSPLPSSIAAVVTLVRDVRPGSTPSPLRVLFHMVTGPSGGNLLGRFCHCDEDLTHALQRFLSSEAALFPDQALAEVVHLPEGRMGNILCRPVLRDYEIPFLGRSGAPASQQIPISDLFVTVRDDRVVLWSRRLGREVLPRITTAHNLSHPRNLPIYRFFALLREQGVLFGASWVWGRLEQLPFLPRVVYGQAVLCRAQWRIAASELALKPSTARVATYQAFQLLRNERGIPRRVLLSEGDSLLSLDLDLPIAVDVVVESIRKHHAVQLAEQYPDDNSLVVEGPEGRFTHELIVPFLRRRQTSREEVMAPNTVTIAPTSIRRKFTPTSGWTYAQLFAGEGTTNRILSHLVAPVIQTARDSGAIDRWFFIRYSDPKPHIRLRLCGDPSRIRCEVLPDLEARSEEFLDNRLLTSLRYDTYSREIERYGGSRSITIAEDVFCADSDFAITVLGGYPGDENAHARDMILLRGIDTLLADLQFTAEQRVLLLGRLRPPSGDARRVWSEAYRANRGDIETVLGLHAATERTFANACEELVRRSMRVAASAARLHDLLRCGELGAALEDIALSLTHMHVNRMVGTTNPVEEQRVYDFIRRFHESAFARVRAVTPPPSHDATNA